MQIEEVEFSFKPRSIGFQSPCSLFYTRLHLSELEKTSKKSLTCGHPEIIPDHVWISLESTVLMITPYWTPALETIL